MFSASVVITTKNRREELLKAIDSAMGQRSLLEVIVIDDGSTDGTEASVMEKLKKDLTTESTENTEEQAGQRLASQAGAAFSNPSPSELARDSENTLRNRSAIGPASQLATSYPPPVTTGEPVLRLIRHEVSAGYIVRRNEGARVARGDVVFSLDDDAVFSSPFVLEQTLRDFSHPRIGAVAIPYIEPHKANREMQRAPTREDVWITASYIGTAHAVRRDVFLALGGYREHLVHQGEEGDFCIRMLAADAEHSRDRRWKIEDGGEEKAESGNYEKLKEDLTTDGTDGRGWKVKAETLKSEHPRDSAEPKGKTNVWPREGNRSEAEQKLKEDLTTDYTDGHGYSAGQRPGSRASASESDSLASELADSPVSESLTRSASGPAEALRASEDRRSKIGDGEIGSGGGKQLADSEGFLKGHSQAGLQMDSQKLQNIRGANAPDTSGQSSSSVLISDISGKKNSGTLGSGRSTLDSGPLSAVPGFFVRLGNSDPIIHNESPKRDYSRMDFYGRRNDVLFHWQNTPMPDLLWQLPKTIAGGLVCAAKVGRWRKMLEGIGAGFLAIVVGVKRQPVSKVIIVVHKSLKSSCQKMSFC